MHTANVNLIFLDRSCLKRVRTGILLIILLFQAIGASWAADIPSATDDSSDVKRQYLMMIAYRQDLQRMPFLGHAMQAAMTGLGATEIHRRMYEGAKAQYTSLTGIVPTQGQEDIDALMGLLHTTTHLLASAGRGSQYVTPNAVAKAASQNPLLKATNLNLDDYFTKFSTDANLRSLHGEYARNFQVQPDQTLAEMINNPNVELAASVYDQAKKVDELGKKLRLIDEKLGTAVDELTKNNLLAEKRAVVLEALVHQMALKDKLIEGQLQADTGADIVIPNYDHQSLEIFQASTDTISRVLALFNAEASQAFSKFSNIAIAGATLGTPVSYLALANAFVDVIDLMMNGGKSAETERHKEIMAAMAGLSDQIFELRKSTVQGLETISLQIQEVQEQMDLVNTKLSFLREQERAQYLDISDWMRNASINEEETRALIASADAASWRRDKAQNNKDFYLAIQQGVDFNALYSNLSPEKRIDKANQILESYLLHALHTSGSEVNTGGDISADPTQLRLLMPTLKARLSDDLTGLWTKLFYSADDAPPTLCNVQELSAAVIAAVTIPTMWSTETKLTKPQTDLLINRVQAAKETRSHIRRFCHWSAIEGLKVRQELLGALIQEYVSESSVREQIQTLPDHDVWEHNAWWHARDFSKDNKAESITIPVIHEVRPNPWKSPEKDFLTGFQIDDFALTKTRIEQPKTPDKINISISTRLFRSTDQDETFFQLARLPNLYPSAGYDEFKMDLALQGGVNCSYENNEVLDIKKTLKKPRDKWNADDWFLISVVAFGDNTLGHFYECRLPCAYSVFQRFPAINLHHRRLFAQTTTNLPYIRFSFVEHLYPQNKHKWIGPFLVGQNLGIWNTAVKDLPGKVTNFCSLVDNSNDKPTAIWKVADEDWSISGFSTDVNDHVDTGTAQLALWRFENRIAKNAKMAILNACTSSTTSRLKNALVDIDCANFLVQKAFPSIVPPIKSDFEIGIPSEFETMPLPNGSTFLSMLEQDIKKHPDVPYSYADISADPSNPKPKVIRLKNFCREYLRVVNGISERRQADESKPDYAEKELDNLLNMLKLYKEEIAS